MSLEIIGVQHNTILCFNQESMQQNFTHIEELITSYSNLHPKKESHHRLFCLTELSSCGYANSCFQCVDLLTEETDGPSFQFYSKLAQKTQSWIGYGFCRNHEKGSTISFAIVNDQGDFVTVYDKAHICQFGVYPEKTYFLSGSEVGSDLVSFKIGEVVLGIAICYDIRFPELARVLAIDHGIHVLLHPGVWERDDTFYSWHSFVITRAIENQIYVLSMNIAGSNNGGSMLAKPFWDSIHKPETLGIEEGYLVAEIDLNYLNEIRQTYNYRGDVVFYHKFKKV